MHKNDNSIEFLGSFGKECAVPGQGRLPECACSRDRGREPAEPERACMMWYRAVAHVSLYFSCPPSLAPRRLPVAVAAHPKSSPPSGGITRVSHYPQRPFVRAHTPGRPFEARPVDRDGSGGGARGRRRWPRPPSAFMLCGFVVIISSSQLCTAAGAARLRKGHRPDRVQTCVERLS